MKVFKTREWPRTTKVALLGVEGLIREAIKALLKGRRAYSAS